MLSFQKIVTWMALPLFLSFSPVSVPAQGNNDPVHNDAVLTDMGRAFQKGERRRLTELLPQARGHVLEPWAAYWELRARLDEASTVEVEAFLARYAGSYQEDRLRNDWLLVLGHRRDWLGVAQHLPKYRMGDDKEVRCYDRYVGWLNRRGTNEAAAALNKEAVEDVLRTWYNFREADESCSFVVQSWLEAKLVKPVDVWRKARLAAETGKVKTAKLALDMVATAPEINALNGVFEQPERWLSAANTSVKGAYKGPPQGNAKVASKTHSHSKGNSSTPSSAKSAAQTQHLTPPQSMSPELAVLALIRLSQTDVDAAADWLEKSWASKLDQEQLNWLWGEFGKVEAQRLRSGTALTYYVRATSFAFSDKSEKDSASGPFPEDMLTWRVRAALRAGDWPTVLEAISALSPFAQTEPAWVYWRARAQWALAKTELEREGARTALRGLASPRGFYEQLAAEELGQKIALPAKAEPLTAAEKEAARNNPGLIRALAAIDLGLRSEGVREWNYATNLHSPGGMIDRELLAAADWACAKLVLDRCINTSDRTKISFDSEQRYPLPLREVVLKRAQEVGLDPAYVYGMIRQESRYVSDARSTVGASGWMQVMPATAKWTAKKMGLQNFNPSQLSDRETNIAIGTAYLKYALDDFQGLMPLAAAAYNAGPSRAKSWRQGASLEGAIWAENVPFNETRDYVKKVLANTTLYAAILSGQPQSLKARLSTIGPRDESLPDPVKDLP